MPDFFETKEIMTSDIYKIKDLQTLMMLRDIDLAEAIRLSRPTDVIINNVWEWDENLLDNEVSKSTKSLNYLSEIRELIMSKYI